MTVENKTADSGGYEHRAETYRTIDDLVKDANILMRTGWRLVSHTRLAPGNSYQGIYRRKVPASGDGECIHF